MRVSMTYNLTEKQKALARFIVEEVQANRLPETFTAFWDASSGLLYLCRENEPYYNGSKLEGDLGQFEALDNSKLLISRVGQKDAVAGSLYHDGLERVRAMAEANYCSCTLTGAIYQAVESNFAEKESYRSVSAFVHPHPPEIEISLERLANKYPDPKRLGFLVMRFTAAKPFDRIVNVIKETAAKHGVTIVRADENEFHADLWGNVRTHLHGCGFGIAVYERIESNEPNANIGLEVGYLMAMNKPVLLLKDRTIQVLQADLAGKLYKLFDPHDPEATIPAELTNWLRDYGIIVPAPK